MPLVSRRFSRNDRLQSASQNSPPLAHGATGLAVELLQTSLVELGFPMPISTKNGNIAGDGIFGTETANTVRAFQKMQGLSADGIAGRDTLGRLDQIVAARETARLMQDRIAVEKLFWT
ncbi:MAG TPA: peptidoglycan-binding domain-containing protein [Gemmataceae bacterium]|nr:peptidoglycan-binding domain-containing protein [Gemmataceae bacterium]